MPDRTNRTRVLQVAIAVLLAALAACAGGGGAGERLEQGADGEPSGAAPVDDVESDEAAGAGATTAPDDDASDEPAGDGSGGDGSGGSGGGEPIPRWTSVSPADAGMDPDALEAMAATAEAAGSECLVVTRDGALVGEWYWEGFDEQTEREVFSVTKSITSTLVGIAQDRGLLDVDDPASDYIEAWKGTPSEGVTIRNLISNDSGRFQDFATDYIQMATQAPDKTAFSIDLEQQHEPGTTWVYNNAAIQTLDEVLEVATGMPTADFAEEALFEPLGMGTTMNRDAAGNTLAFMGAQASCRDLARFGLLFLRGGEWGGEQIVSAEWVAEATSPSQDLNEGYGFLWWLNRTASSSGTDEVPAYGSAEEATKAVTGRTYAALGLFNQLVGVYPDAGIVATRLGADKGPDGGVFGLGDLSAGVLQAMGEEPPVAEDVVG